MKNIPLPSKDTYKKRLIKKVESVIKRMRWKAFFFDKNKKTDKSDNSIKVETEWKFETDTKKCFKSRKCPPQNKDMNGFEDDVLLLLIKNLKFRKVNNPFQRTLHEDIKAINQCDKALIFADKSRNLYEVDKEQYGKLMKDNITKSYKKAGRSIENELNKEAKEIAEKLKIGDRMECLANQQAFITLKDHKDNFQNNPTCRLINPTKREMGLISKQILERVNIKIRNTLKVHQWRNTSAVIEWFEKIQDKQIMHLYGF